MEDSYKAIQELGALRQKVDVFSQAYSSQDTFKRVPAICFDARKIEELIYVDEELKVSASRYP